MAEKQKRAREEGWGSERAMLAGCNSSFRVWMSSHLHFCAPSLDLHSLVVKAIDFKTDELLVRCNLSGVESDGHLHGPSRAKDALWAAHLQVRGAGEQAAQAGRKHREKQRCHKAARAPRETSGLLGALPSPLSASSGQEGLDGPSRGALSWHEVSSCSAEGNGLAWSLVWPAARGEVNDGKGILGECLVKPHGQHSWAQRSLLCHSRREQHV